MASYKEYEPLALSEQTMLDNENENEEEQNLLPSHNSPSRSRIEKSSQGRSIVLERISSFNPITTLIIGYGAGLFSVLLPLLLVRYCWAASFSTDTPPQYLPHGINPALRATKLASFPADIGSTEIHIYPPIAPTNAIPSLFPTKVGFPGPTATGAEPGLVMTAGEGMYPSWGGVEGLVRPKLWEEDSVTVGDGDREEMDKFVPEWIDDDVVVDSKWKGKGKKPKFDIFKHWGNLTPFHSVPSDSFGIESKTSPDVPGGCTLKGVHILHRHGARYPTDWLGYAAPASLASKLHHAASSSSVGKMGSTETQDLAISKGGEREESKVAQETHGREPAVATVR